MNRLRTPALMHVLLGMAAAWLLATLPVFTPTAHANNWGEMAMVSETMGVFDSRICIGEASRGDLGCPTYAPTISPTGRINASAGLTVNSVSLTTTGTTWGYLGSAQSYLPNLSSNAISATNISASTINGISVTALGGSSPTSVPAFFVHKNGSNQTLPSATLTKITFSTKELDTYNNFNIGTSRFTPTIGHLDLPHFLSPTGRFEAHR